jgi:rRNA maturation RNase YbeY
VALTRRIIAAAGNPADEIGLFLVGDRRMRRLNRRYRGRNSPTDVLAFPMRAFTPPLPRSRGRVREGAQGSPLLGDVVISLPQAARQAKADGHSVDDELAVLLIHGILHLVGYDHERGEREAARMRRKERAILRSLMPLPKLIVSSK